MRKILSTVILLVMYGTFAGNLIKNGDFSDGLNHWISVNNKITLSTDEKVSGAASAKSVLKNLPGIVYIKK